MNQYLKYNLNLNTLFFTSLIVVAMQTLSLTAFSAQGFVAIPKQGFTDSAYTLCNPTGDFGLKESTAPNAAINNNCAVSNEKLLESPMNAPLEGFTLVGLISRGIQMPAHYAGEFDEVATLTDTIWRNADKTECIYGTHLLMKPNVLADGQMWEVNDIARGGFSGRPVEVAYFIKPEPHKEYGFPEAVFRVGRTFTSVNNGKNTLALPALQGAPDISKAMTNIQAAAVNENWVDFTTDVNAKDPDGVTRMMSSMLYIKTICSDYAPVEVENAIRLLTTGQNGQHQLEITVPGLVPPNGVIEKY